MESRASWISFILTALAITILNPATAGAADLIYDSEGHILQQGVEYYVLPSTKGNGGGLTLKMRNKICPVYVAQEKSERSQGLPVVFTPLSSGETFEDGINVHITTAGATICAQSTTWNVDSASGDNHTFIEASSATGSVFRIVKEGDDDYVLYWCPLVCKSCGVGPVCQKLGLYIDEEQNRWIVLQGSQPLNVRFKMAHD